MLLFLRHVAQKAAELVEARQVGSGQFAAEREDCLARTRRTLLCRARVIVRLRRVEHAERADEALVQGPRQQRLREPREPALQECGSNMRVREALQLCGEVGSVGLEHGEEALQLAEGACVAQQTLLAEVRVRVEISECGAQHLGHVLVLRGLAFHEQAQRLREDRGCARVVRLCPQQLGPLLELLRRLGAQRECLL